jgi:hypothetical protein
MLFYIFSFVFLRQFLEAHVSFLWEQGLTSTIWNPTKSAEEILLVEYIQSSLYRFILGIEDIFMV